MREHRLRIGIEANAYYKNTAGTGVYIRSLVEQWRLRNDMELVLFCNGRPSEMDDKRKKNIFKRIFNGFRDILWMQFVLPLKADKERVDVLLCPAFLSPVIAPCPVILCVHDMSIKRYPEMIDAFFRLYLRMLLPWCIKTAGLVMTISEFSRSEILEFFPNAGNKVRSVLLASHPRFAIRSSNEDIRQVKERYCISGDYILSVGTIEPRKNMIALIRAFDLLRERHLTEASLVICGNKGWYYTSIFDGASRERLAGKIIFTGFVPDTCLPALYQGASLFVFPSLYEGFGLPVAEAMASGCPVITSDKASLPEVAGEGALIADCSEPGKLADAMHHILTDRNACKELRERAVRRSEELSWKKTADSTLAFIREIIA